MHELPWEYEPSSHNCMLYSVGTVKPSSHVVHYALYMWPGIWVWSVGVPIMPTQNTGQQKEAHTRQFFNVSHSNRMAWIWRTGTFCADRQQRWQTDTTNHFTSCACAQGNKMLLNCTCKIISMCNELEWCKQLRYTSNISPGLQHIQLLYVVSVSLRWGWLGPGWYHP